MCFFLLYDSRNPSYTRTLKIRHYGAFSHDKTRAQALQLTERKGNDKGAPLQDTSNHTPGMQGTLTSCFVRDTLGPHFTIPNFLASPGQQQAQVVSADVILNKGPHPSCAVQRTDEILPYEHNHLIMQGSRQHFLQGTHRGQTSALLVRFTFVICGGAPQTNMRSCGAGGRTLLSQTAGTLCTRTSHACSNHSHLKGPRIQPHIQPEPAWQARQRALGGG